MTCWLAADFVGRAVADLAPVVQHDDAVRDVHHDSHVVLDQHDGRPEFVVDVEHEARHVLLFLEIHAGHRLVEQQYLRLHRQRAREINALLQPVRQSPDRCLAVGLDLEKVDDVLDELAVPQFLAPREAQVHGLRQQPGAHAQDCDRS